MAMTCNHKVITVMHTKIFFTNFLINRPGFIKTAFTLMLFALLSACSGMDVLEQDFGTSARLMEQGQIYDMEAANNPSPDGPESIDGNKSLADLNQLERPVTAEKQMLNYIKARKFEIGE